MSNTIVLGYTLPGVPVLANPADYLYAIPSVAANVGIALQGQGGSSYFSGAENDSPVVEYARLWCNFADGLVFNTVDNPPLVAYWQGDDTLPGASIYRTTTFRTLNEWMPVNMPLKRSDTVGSWGGMSCQPFGNLSFYTKSINPAYAASQPIFEFQWIVRGGTW